MPRSELDIERQRVIRGLATSDRRSYERRKSEERQKRIAALLLQRKYEAAALFRWLPTGLAFHESRKMWRLVMGSNRAGKSLAADFDFAGCVCQWDDKYYPTGQALIVGNESDHLAQIYRTCFEEGAFACIADEHTGELRAVRPDPEDPLQLDPYDAAYREKWKPAPPLIPKRLVRKIAWDQAAKDVPRMITFTTGWTSLWRTSRSDPPRGEHWGFVLFDEQLVNGEYASEAHRGLTRTYEPSHQIPRGIWSATAQDCDPRLDDWAEKAENGSETFDLFHFDIFQNPYITEQDRQTFAEGLPDDEIATRIKGVRASLSKRCYPSYDPMGIHGCEPFEVPLDWTRYLFVDPGTNICATSLVAIDPDERHAWLYDAFEVYRLDAQAWAQQVKRREKGVKFQAMVIDKMAGTQRPMGFNITVAQQYWNALEEVGVSPVMLGPLDGFMPSQVDVKARTMALAAWLELRTQGPFRGKPVLQVFRGAVPDRLHRQVKQAREDDRFPRKKLGKHQEDLLVTLEYAAAYDPKWYTPILPEKHSVSTDRLWKKFLEKQHQLS